jgi:signal transduction histidine kinase/HAMP domain-containing protein
LHHQHRFSRKKEFEVDMKLKNIKISQQINIGISVLLILIILSGLVAIVDSDRLWQSTKGLYDHPMTVQRAIGSIQTDILNIRLQMKEMITENSEAKIQDRIIAIDTYEAEAYKQLDILYNNYLGPKSDIDAAYNSIVKWKPIRDETIRILRAGNIEEAAQRSSFEGVGGAQAQQVIVDLATIYDFAINRADQFYAEAQALKDQLIRQQIIILILLVLLSIGISIVLRRGILAPLRELSIATNSFKEGKLDARSQYESTNEFGELSGSFNTMTETIQTEIQNKEKLAQVSSIMFQQDDFQLFCQELLKSLLQHTGSQVGAVYLLNEDQNIFEHFASIGLGKQNYATFSAAGRDGEFGSALATGKVQHLKEIPAESQITFTTVSGDLKANEIMTIPIMNGNKIVAIISLASIKSYSESAIWLVNSLTNELSARFNSILASRQILDFSEKLQKVNVELQQQAKELAMQSDELTEQNIELEMQKNQLSEANQLKTSFLSNMSHELRTPLNSVIALTSVLNHRLQGAIPEEEYSYLDVIERNGKNLLSLVNDLLDLSRIEAGKEELYLTQFSLKNLVSEIVEMIDPQAHKKGITVTNLISDEIPNIQSDIQKCRHILQNLIGNAVKFTDEGDVVINAKFDKGEIEIMVRDTGIGIAATHLDFIFDEFRQADESASRKNGGTGLGLAIAKKYAQLLGGSIKVASIVGNGSIFTLTLPLKIWDPASMEAGEAFGHDEKPRPASASTWPAGQSKCILLVEDSEPAIIQTKDILEERGYQIYIARNGKEALEQLELIQPDGMILDLMMPEMDGFEVLKTVREIDKLAKMPVLILSAKHITHEELSFLKSNHIFQLIQKGAIDKKQLLNAVGAMVNQQLD